MNLPIFLLCHLEYFASDIPQNCHSWHRQSYFSFLLLLLCFINCPFSLPFNSPSPSLIVQSHAAPVNYLFSLMLFTFHFSLIFFYFILFQLLLHFNSDFLNPLMTHMHKRNFIFEHFVIKRTF